MATVVITVAHTWSWIMYDRLIEGLRKKKVLINHHIYLFSRDMKLYTNIFFIRTDDYHIPTCCLFSSLKLYIHNILFFSLSIDHVILQ